MSEELTYKRLRDLAREEKAQPGLVRLPAEFYGSAETFLSSKFAEMESSRSVLQMREFENSVAVVKEITTVRQQKILFKAIRSGGVHGETTEMTKEEHSLYDRFCSVLEDEKNRLDSMLTKYEKRKLQKPEESDAPRAITADSGIKKVRFVKDVPAYKGVNNETFGPFTPGQEIQLPTNEAEWLLKGKLVESV